MGDCGPMDMRRGSKVTSTLSSNALPSPALHPPAMAQSTPDTAQSTSDTAQSTSDTAQSTSDTAQSTPDTAQSTPDTAQSTPDTAGMRPSVAPNRTLYTSPAGTCARVEQFLGTAERILKKKLGRILLKHCRCWRSLLLEQTNDMV